VSEDPRVLEPCIVGRVREAAADRGHHRRSPPSGSGSGSTRRPYERR